MPIRKNWPRRWRIAVAASLLLAGCATRAPAPSAQPCQQPPAPPPTVTAEPAGRDFLSRLVNFFSALPAKPMPSSPSSSDVEPGR